MSTLSITILGYSCLWSLLLNDNSSHMKVVTFYYYRLAVFEGNNHNSIE